MNYLSSNITVITLVLVVLQITAWENWSNFLKGVLSFNGAVMVISQRAATVTSPAWLAMVYRWSFLFRSRSQPLLIRAPNLFYRHTCHDSGLSTHVSNFDYLLKLFHRVQKTATMHFFHVFFTGWLHVFDHCAKTVRVTRKTKTNVSSTMIYLSYGTSLITVVHVVLQITRLKY